jgi:mannose-6-phosphate isomerase-like protein (cupin superfamily)
MAQRRDLFKIAGFGALAAWAGPAAADEKLPTGTMPASQAKSTKEPFGDLRIYHDGPTDQLKSMTAGSLLLKAGMTPHAPHRHEEEEFMVVAEGSGEISVEGRMTRVSAGSMMYCAANKVHGIVNTGSRPLLFYFYKWKA